MEGSPDGLKRFSEQSIEHQKHLVVLRAFHYRLRKGPRVTTYAPKSTVGLRALHIDHDSHKQVYILFLFRKVCAMRWALWDMLSKAIGA